jgi:beta-phosphoglucomutase
VNEQENQKGRSHLMNMAVLFDMDGVLVDSEPIINAAAIRALAEFGIQARPEDFEPFIGAGDDRYVGGVAELYGKVYAVEMKHRTYGWYLKLLPEMGRAFPGARNLVERLHQHGIACAVASSADRIKVEANLTTVLEAPLDLFAALVTGEDVVRRKPHPDIFFEAARRLKLPREACCVVEDAIHGVRAAKAAGMHCVAVATTFPAETLAAAGADLVRPAIAAITLDDLLVTRGALRE